MEAKTWEESDNPLPARGVINKLIGRREGLRQRLRNGLPGINSVSDIVTVTVGERIRGQWLCLDIGETVIYQYLL